MPSAIHSISYEDVEFKTIDGLILRGSLYPAASRGAAVIMTPGFNCVKEMLLPEVAESFQRDGFTVLTYDPRSIGLSDGLPRNEIDPMKQVEDYSDALTFLAKNPLVDPSRIAFWGMSFSGSVAACAAALDKRAKLVIMICPFVKFYTDEKRIKVLEKVMADRVSQSKGNKSFSVIPFNSSGDNPAGMALGGGQEAYEFMTNVKERGATNFENRTTIQSYYKIAMWQPWGLMDYVNPTPVMMLIPQNDRISSPEDQKNVFDGFKGPKHVCLVPNKGHLDVLSGDRFYELMREQSLRTRIVRQEGQTSSRQQPPSKPAARGILSLVAQRRYKTQRFRILTGSHLLDVAISQ
ncbi:MAG: hypothetical protein Q9187_000767 [Circinaria calcarea]